jgi:ankyrin repeat protein
MDVRSGPTDDAVTAPATTAVDDLAAAIEQGREGDARTLAQAVAPRELSLLLHRFAAAKKPAAVTTLLGLGADPNVRDDGGANALHHAAAVDDQASAEALIAAGADLDLRDVQHGSSPVLWAENFHHTDMVRLLLRHGARVNLPDAAKLGLAGVAQGFLDVIPESIDKSVAWPTPLVAAVANGHLSLVRLLLERGADPNTPAADGQKPLQATKWVDDEKVRTEISALLESFGAAH